MWRSDGPKLALQPSLPGNSLAYLAVTCPAGGDRYECWVRGHGPQAQQLISILIALVQQWGQQHRGYRAYIDVYPAGTSLPPDATGRVVTKRRTQIVLTWPSSPASSAHTGPCGRAR